MGPGRVHPDRGRPLAQVAEAGDRMAARSHYGHDDIPHLRAQSVDGRRQVRATEQCRGATIQLDAAGTGRGGDRRVLSRLVDGTGDTVIFDPFETGCVFLITIGGSCLPHTITSCESSRRETRARGTRAVDHWLQSRFFRKNDLTPHTKCHVLRA